MSDEGTLEAGRRGGQPFSGSGALFILSGLLFLSGCIVRSLNPWLLPETILKGDRRLVGTWHDKNDRATMFLALSSEGEYRMIFVTNPVEGEGGRYPVKETDKYEVSEFTATFHGLDGALFLVVGPRKQEGKSRWTAIPAYLLLKLELNEKSMRAFMLSPKRVEEELKGKDMIQHGGIILTQTMENLSRLVRSWAKDPSLWEAQPRYEFDKIGEGADVEEKGPGQKGKGK